MTQNPARFQFSLRFVLVVLAGWCSFLALVRMSDVASATIFVVFLMWLLSPVIATFGVLYWQGSATRASMIWRRRQRERSERQVAGEEN